MWLPENIDDFLLVTIDPSQSSDTEWKNMMLLNHSAHNWIDGGIDTEMYCDILDSCGIDPVEFLLPVQQHIIRFS